jgi:hypothetical protein
VIRFWEWFWTVAIVVAGTSFAFITVVVAIRGGRDLETLFRRLREQRDDQSPDVISRS